MSEQPAETSEQATKMAHTHGPSQPLGWDEDCIICNPEGGQSSQAGYYVLWREGDVDEDGNVHPVAISGLVTPPGVTR